MPLDVQKTLRGPLKFKQYLYLTVGHLIPVEICFATASYLLPHFEKPILFLNYMYMMIVALHAVHWGFKRMGFVAKMLFFLKPYFDAVEKMLRHCPHCNTVVSLRVKTCPACRKPLPDPDPSQVYVEFTPEDVVGAVKALKEFTASKSVYQDCPNCHARFSGDISVCPGCGLDVNVRMADDLHLDD